MRRSRFPGRFAAAVAAASLITLSCISIPENPPVESDRCVNSFFTMRREVSEIQEDNRLTQIGLIGVGCGLGLFIPEFLILAVVGAPMHQLHHRHKARTLVSDWYREECRVD